MSEENSEDLAAENKRLREALRQYAVRENWACGRTQDQNVWERDYEHGWKLAEETLGEGRICPTTPPDATGMRGDEQCLDT